MKKYKVLKDMGVGVRVVGGVVGIIPIGVKKDQIVVGEVESRILDTRGWDGPGPGKLEKYDVLVYNDVYHDITTKCEIPLTNLVFISDMASSSSIFTTKNIALGFAIIVVLAVIFKFKK